MRFHSAIASASPRADGKSEDRVAIHPIRDAVVVVIADGAGGITGGAIAADTFMAGVAEVLDRDAASLLRPDAIVALLRRLDGVIERMPFAGETTGIVVVVTIAGIHGASCGDSSAWLVDDRAYDELTVGQQRKVRLGSGRAAPVAFSRGPFEGTLVVGTDGLFACASPDTICSAAGRASVDIVAAALIAAARTVTGALWDDVTVAVVRM